MSAAASYLGRQAAVITATVGVKAGAKALGHRACDALISDDGASAEQPHGTFQTTEASLSRDRQKCYDKVDFAVDLTSKFGFALSQTFSAGPVNTDEDKWIEEQRERAQENVHRTEVGFQYHAAKHSYRPCKTRLHASSSLMNCVCDR